MKLVRVFEKYLTNMTEVEKVLVLILRLYYGEGYLASIEPGGTEQRGFRYIDSWRLAGKIRILIVL